MASSSGGVSLGTARVGTQSSSDVLSFNADSATTMFELNPITNSATFSSHLRVAGASSVSMKLESSISSSLQIQGAQAELVVQSYNNSAALHASSGDSMAASLFLGGVRLWNDGLTNTFRVSSNGIQLLQLSHSGSVHLAGGIHLSGIANKSEVKQHSDLNIESRGLIITAAKTVKLHPEESIAIQTGAAALVRLGTSESDIELKRPVQQSGLGTTTILSGQKSSSGEAPVCYLLFCI